MLSIFFAAIGLRAVALIDVVNTNTNSTIVARLVGSPKSEQISQYRH